MQWQHHACYNGKKIDQERIDHGKQKKPNQQEGRMCGRVQKTVWL